MDFEYHYVGDLREHDGKTHIWTGSEWVLYSNRTLDEIKQSWLDDVLRHDVTCNEE